MEVVTTPAALRARTVAWRRQGHRVGLVPTMGAIHAGHLSLCERARAECPRVVASIFINPLQFGAGEDLDRYPRDAVADQERLSAAGVECCFLPEPPSMYPRGFATRVSVERGTERWEGAARPAHFAGVATVVAKLFVAAGPCRAYFGEKDAQQAQMVARLARDLDTGVRVVVCPTVREPDGLALSSRNRYLDPESRRAAPCLAQGLRAAVAAFAGGTRGAVALAEHLATPIRREPLAEIEYAAIVHPRTFAPVRRADASSRALVAASIRGVRLLDTIVLGAPQGL